MSSEQHGDSDASSVQRQSPPTPEEPQDLRRHLFLLALPVLGEQFLTFSIGLFDVYLSGRLGKAETAAIGLSAYVSWLASMTFSLVGTGTSAVIAREWGAGRLDEARRIAGRSLCVTPIVGGCVFLSLQLLATWFPYLLNMEGDQRRIAVQFLRIDACGQFFAGWTLIASAALRGSGDMVSPLRILIVTNLVNVCVSTLCTFGLPPLIPGIGVLGIVTGTASAHLCGATLMTWRLSEKSSPMHVTLADFEFHRGTIARVLRIGGPAALGGFCAFLGHFLFLMVIARVSSAGFDGAVFAAHVVGVRIEALSYLPVEAFGIAAATLVGQSLGANWIERARQVGHEALLQCVWYAALMTVLFFAFAPQIYAMMHEDPQVGLIGVPAFRLMSGYQVPNAILIVYIWALRGAGDTRFPLFCSLIGNVIVRVGVGYLCGVELGWGLFGAWIGMGADNILRSILVSWRYLSGHWTRIRV